MYITIRQLGGHKGSYAGDCAIVEIDCGASSQVIVIDTGSTTIWKNGGEFKALVTGALKKRANVPRTLITSHFHEDHFNEVLFGSVAWTNWFHGRGLKGTPNKGKLVEGYQRGLLSGNEGEWHYIVDCWAPDWSKKEAGVPKDENDLSLGTAVYVSNGLGGFSFLSFGDMTPDAEARMTYPFFPASVAKFPHHGSENNYLKYFKWGIAETVLISGDSGSAVNTAKALHGDNKNVDIRVLARTSEADQQFKSSWKTACDLDAELLKANLQVGKDIVIAWASGESAWGELQTFDLDGAVALQKGIKKMGRRELEEIGWK